MRKFLLIAILFMLSMGCASRHERLSKEYELVSRQMEALQNEQKSLVNAEQAASTYIEAKKHYQQQMSKLHGVREQNQGQDMPTGPAIPKELEVEEIHYLLKKNQDIISDRIRELEKKRKAIVTEQTQLEIN